MCGSTYQSHCGLARGHPREGPSRNDGVPAVAKRHREPRHLLWYLPVVRPKTLTFPTCLWLAQQAQQPAQVSHSLTYLGSHTQLQQPYSIDDDTSPYFIRHRPPEILQSSSMDWAELGLATREEIFSDVDDVSTRGRIRRVGCINRPLSAQLTNSSRVERPVSVKAK